MKINSPNKDYFPDRENTRKHLREGSLPKDHEKFDDLARRAFRGLQSLGQAEALDESLQRIDQRFVKKIRQPSKRPGFSGPLRIAAAITVLLVSAAAWFWWPPAASTADPDDLFAQHFAPVPSAIPLSGTLRGDDSAYSLKREGIKAYEATYYEKASHSLEAYLQQQPGDTEVRFYYGIALLARDQAAAAIEQLSMVYQQPPRPAYQAAAAWYLGLANLKTGQEQQALTFLQELAKDHDNDYQKQAIRLLKQLGHDVSSVDTTKLPGLGYQLLPKKTTTAGPFF